jgi:hypothetical protein
MFACVLFSVVPAVVSGGQMPEQGTPYYTNKDIEKYERPADKTRTAVATPGPPQKNDKASEIAEEKEKEYWCKKASSARNNVEKKQDTIDEIEQEIAGRHEKGLAGDKAEKSLQKRLTKARRERGYAEKSFGEIADEAHRKGIPPGWLRCQFE